ncbi:hypothetical protein [Mycobacterium hubeiense]|nr:hypothetical protein [Mycobacterium sp. QGD 101]
MNSLDDALRAQPGYMETLERDAAELSADPTRGVTVDWENL